jgi:hypothetical protein
MRKAKVQSVTSLGDSPEVERNKRFKSYFISMLIRFVCILLAVFIPFPYNLLAMVGAIFIPFFAVVNANSKKVDVSDFKPLVLEPLRIDYKVDNSKDSYKDASNENGDV